MTDGPRVLAVGRETTVGRSLQTATIETVPGAAAALERVSGEYDGVLSAADLPDGDGLSLLEEVRDRWPTLPVVLVTPEPDPDLAVRAAHAGVVYLPQQDESRDPAVLDMLTADPPAHEAEAETNRPRPAGSLGTPELSTGPSLNTQDELFYVLDSEGMFIRWNDALHRTTGYSEAELEQMHVTECFPPDERSRVLEAIETVLDGGQTTLTADLVTAVGDRISYRFSVSSVTDGHGSIVGVAGTGRDSHHSDAHTQMIMDLHEAAAELARCHTKAAIFEETIEAAETLLGFEQVAVLVEDDEQLVLEACSDEFPAERLPRLSLDEGIAGHSFQTGDSIRVDDIDTVPEGDPGSSNIVSVISVPIDQTGVLQVTDPRKRAFDDRDLELAKLLVTHVENAIQQVERARALEHLQEASVELYGADSASNAYDILIDSAVEILGFDWCAVAEPAPDEPRFMIRAVSAGAPVETDERTLGLDEGVTGKVYQTKSPRVTETAGSDPDGQPIDDSIRSGLTVPIGERGVFQAVAAHRGAFDTDDLRRAELLVAAFLTALERIEHRSELEAKNERLEEFTSVVSHDLRNPLNVATGHLELASDGFENDHLEYVREALERVDVLIEELLALSRSSEPVEETTAVALAGLAEACWRGVPTRSATLEIDTDIGIRANRSRLRQVLENLFRNAVDHGGEAITVRVGSLEDGFYVEDDGVGIPLEQHEHVFERTYTTSSDGTGFGLSIVRDICESHGWEIELEPTTSRTRFEITGVEFVD